MSLSIDWPCAIAGLAVGYVAKGKVEDVKASAKKAVSDTAAAAAIAAANAVNGGQPQANGQAGQKTV